MKKMLLLSENQVKYVEDIIVEIDTANLGMSRRGDTGHIRARPGRVFCSIGESLVLIHSGKAAETFEKAWAGGCISVNNYRTITYFFVTTVLL